MIYPNTDGADEGDIYIGSTTTVLSKRMAGHRYSYTRKDHFSSHILFDKYGIDNCKIELVCDFPCLSKNELNREEGKYIRERKCVNKRVPGRSRIEYRQDNKDDIQQLQKAYYQENKEKLQKRNKIYNEEHKQELKNHRQEFYQKNKERMKKETRERYLVTSEKLKEKVTCECGCVVSRNYLTDHKKRKAHLDLITTTKKITPPYKLLRLKVF